MNKEKFSYIIGHKWPDGSLSAYAYGSEVKYGTLDDAKEFLKYVKEVSDDSLKNNWKIYKIIEYD